MVSAIAISEPGAGGDPAGMKTRAVLEGAVGDQRPQDLDQQCARSPISSSSWPASARAMRGMEASPPLSSRRARPALSSSAKSRCSAAARTYEIVFEDCRIPADSVLGEIGKGYAPMQLRLRTRRLEMGSTCIGIREGRGAFRRALRGRDIAVNFGSPPLPQPDLQQFKRADDPGQEIVEVVGDAAGQLADRLHFWDLAQLCFGRPDARRSPRQCGPPASR